MRYYKTYHISWCYVVNNLADDVTSETHLKWINRWSNIKKYVAFFEYQNVSSKTHSWNQQYVIYNHKIIHSYFVWYLNALFLVLTYKHYITCYKTDISSKTVLLTASPFSTGFLSNFGALVIRKSLRFRNRFGGTFGLATASPSLACTSELLPLDIGRLRLNLRYPTLKRGS